MEQTAALLRLQEFKQILLTFKMLFIFAERYFRRKRIKGKKKKYYLFHNRGGNRYCVERGNVCCGKKGRW